MVDEEYTQQKPDFYLNAAKLVNEGFDAIKKKDDRAVSKNLAKIVSLGDQLSTKKPHPEDAVFHYDAAAFLFSTAGREAEYLGDFRNSAKHHAMAAKLYSKASKVKDSQDTWDYEDNDDKVQRVLGRMLGKVYDPNFAAFAHSEKRQAKEAREKAAIYKATEKMNPIRRKLVRSIKLEQLATSLLLAILFISPTLTGNVIDSNLKVSSFVGGLFFININIRVFLYREKKVN